MTALRASALVFFLLSVCSFASNVDEAPTTSPSMDVLGFLLGSKLEIPECYFKKSGNYHSYESDFTPKPKSSKPCWRHITSRAPFMNPGAPIDPQGQKIELSISTDSIPDGFSRKRLWAVALIVNGNIEAVELETKGIGYQNDVFNLLTEKYDLPTYDEIRLQQNRMGGTFDVISATWEFSNLTVVFLGAANSTDSGLVAIRTNIGLAVENSIRQQTSQKKPKL